RKAPEELALLRRAADITVEAMTAAMREARPGMGEHELEALVHYVFRRNGGDGPGYGTIVGAGDNATILHYTDNDHLLDADELVLIDAGCEYQSYTADITRTFPVSGRFSPPQRRCYELVLAVQKAAVAMVRPGVTVDDVQAHVVRGLSAAMVELGLCEGPVEACIEDERYKRFYPHRSSHWLGLDVHDAGDYTRDGAPRPLEPGMVVTVEPGLYIPADAEGVPAEYRGIGIRIEDDVLVTADGHDNLTAAAPKEIADIEAACAGGNAPPRAP
uniref:M24B family metallopeptidase n=1 Tax=Haliangium sp. TaxID=2663208 RepID=UPI003D0B6EAC